MNERNNSKADMSTGYSLGRWAARQWVNSNCGKIRLLNPDATEGGGGLLLVLNGAPNFLHAAALAAALDRPVHISIARDPCQGIWPRWIASQLGVSWQEPEKGGTSAARMEVSDRLARGEAVAIFAEMEPARSEALAPSCVAAARMALDARTAGGQGIAIVPLHALDSYGESAAGELVIAGGVPVTTGELQGGASADSSLRALAGAIEDGLAKDPFRLEERDLKFFLNDLESLLRADLEEDWAARANWKQKSEGFEISRFLVECAEDLNARDPSTLGGLRIELERYRDELRRSALLQAEGETADEWLQSVASRARYWMEAILEAPIALYGFVTHMLPIALLVPGDLAGRVARKDPGQAWLLRLLVVLGNYFLLVSLCARWRGRAAAGYFALTLPLGGVALWRFSRLVRTRIRLMVLAHTLSRRREKIRRLRKRFIEHLNRARDGFANAMNMSR
jgi:hypothetical protein